MNTEQPQINHGFETETKEHFVIAREDGSSDKPYYIGEEFRPGYKRTFGDLSQAKRFDAYPEAADVIKTFAPGIYSIEKKFFVEPKKG